VQQIVQQYPGRDPDDLFSLLRNELWSRRREIADNEMIDGILKAIRWDPAKRIGSGKKRVMLLKCTVDVKVRAEEIRILLHIPVKKHESLYCQRIGRILETLHQEEDAPTIVDDSMDED